MFVLKNDAITALVIYCTRISLMSEILNSYESIYYWPGFVLKMFMKFLFDKIFITFYHTHHYSWFSEGLTWTHIYDY